MLTAIQIQSMFPTIIEYINSECGKLEYEPANERFRIITKDKKIIFKSYDEIIDKEEELKRMKRGTQKPVNYKPSNSIEIL